MSCSLPPRLAELLTADAILMMDNFYPHATLAEVKDVDDTAIMAAHRDLADTLNAKGGEFVAAAAEAGFSPAALKERAENATATKDAMDAFIRAEKCK